MADRKTGSLIAENRKAYHDYFIEERFEAGIELAGTEVKTGKARFNSPVTDFYLTNPIARASAVMGECAALAAGLKQAAE